MAPSKALISLLLISLGVLLHLVDSKHEMAIEAAAPPPTLPAPPPQIDCEGACAGRCAKASRQHMCMRACGSCCGSCNCVPPGTSGNAELCPCYYNIRTHGNKRKCP